MKKLQIIALLIIGMTAVSAFSTDPFIQGIDKVLKDAQDLNNASAADLAASKASLVTDQNAAVKKAIADADAMGIFAYKNIDDYVATSKFKASNNAKSSQKGALADNQNSKETCIKNAKQNKEGFQSSANTKLASDKLSSSKAKQQADDQYALSANKSKEEKAAALILANQWKKQVDDTSNKNIASINSVLSKALSQEDAKNTACATDADALLAKTSKSIDADLIKANAEFDSNAKKSIAQIDAKVAQAKSNDILNALKEAIAQNVTLKGTKAAKDAAALTAAKVKRQQILNAISLVTGTAKLFTVAELVSIDSLLKSSTAPLTAAQISSFAKDQNLKLNNLTMFIQAIQSLQAVSK